MRLAYGSLVVIAAFAGCDSEITNETTGASASSSSSTSSAMGGSGGSSGTGGFGGTSTSALPECVNDTDCTLLDSCCTCQGVSMNESLPDCPLVECFALTCEANGLPLPTTVCRASHCVVNADCNPNHVQCDKTMPMCPPGLTPLVVNGCWGGCLAVAECSEVGSCTQCLNGQACVDSNTMMLPAQHCVDVPASCNGQISCACMGESVCGFAQGCMQVSPTELKCLDITTK